MPYSNTMGSEIRKAAYSIHNLFNLEWVQDKAIPLKLLKQAKGLAFLTVLKAGLVFAPRIGTGLVIARLPDNSWSAPSAIGTFGCSWGALVGADITDYVIILNTSEAVEAFSGSGQISIGAGIEIAVGPIGREISGSYNVGTKGFSPAYSYSHSRGAYAGVGLDGSFILSRNAINFNFYGQQLEPDQILRGDISAPRAGQPLYDQLHNAAFSAEDAPSYTPGYSTTLAGGPSQGSDEVTHVKTPTCSSSGASKSSVSGSDFFGEDAANVYNDLKFRREEVGKIDDLNTADICTGGMI
jgi:lipid-binding SYLF domain-containing protein